jgi:hypothetical protein
VEAEVGGREWYLHDQVASEGTHACDADAGFGGAVCCSYACVSALQLGVVDLICDGVCSILHPKIMANAMPPIPRKGANLGATSFSKEAIVSDLLAPRLCLS